MDSNDVPEELLHENEIKYMRSGWAEWTERDHKVWHIRDGLCDCSFDCCLEPSTSTPSGYKCICPDCPTENCLGG